MKLNSFTFNQFVRIGFLGDEWIEDELPNEVRVVVEVIMKEGQFDFNLFQNTLYRVFQPRKIVKRMTLDGQERTIIVDLPSVEYIRQGESDLYLCWCQFQGPVTNPKDTMRKIAFRLAHFYTDEWMQHHKHTCWLCGATIPENHNLIKGCPDCQANLITA